MPQFDQIQQKLAQMRRSHEDAKKAVSLVTEQLARVESQLTDLQRRTNANDAQSHEALLSLEAKKRRLQATREQSEDALDRISVDLASAAGAFSESWSDPRRHANRMRDDIPIMLFPLRLETRFKTVADAAGKHEQLWVRIYPDECLVDTFEEMLSPAELLSAGIFWREYFRAAGVEAAERAAWRGLVASHGSGRATWIVKHYRPLNPLRPSDASGDPAFEMKPQSIAAGEIILVAATEEVTTTVERGAIASYWKALWKAAGNASLESAASNQLSAAVGAARAVLLVERSQPYNFKEAPPVGFGRDTTIVRVIVLSLPKSEHIDTKAKSWTQAARANLLPERFVLLGYQGTAEVLNQLGAPVQAPFAVSPDPQADTESQFQFDAHGNLSVGDELRWMLDFDEAVRRGMGFRVDLTPQQATGFDRLFVLGLRLSTDATAGKDELQTLLQHHYFSRSGFGFVPQGAATNNTEGGNAAHSRGDDADSSYDFVFKGKSQFAQTEDWLDKSDGQCFAESLGLDSEWLEEVPHAGAVDQREARAMNTALWPATLGYFMDTLLQPVFDDDEIYHARWFFNRFVSGRGAIPAIRIGRQPYGILPTSAFRRIRWTAGDGASAYGSFVERFQERRGTTFKTWLPKFKGVLDRLRQTWDTLARDVAHVDKKNGNPHQTLLDIVGLHPASVEFHQRYANTRDQEHNIASLWHQFISWRTLPANELHNEAFAMLANLGYSGAQTPQLFDLFWKMGANRLTGPTIQSGPLSETEALRSVTANDRNYIEWLHEWAKVSFDTIRVQDGFESDRRPNALLYVLLKHALELGYHDAGIRVLDDAQLLDQQSKHSLRSEPHFFQVQEASVAALGPVLAKSRYEVLYSPVPVVTGDSATLLVDHITRGLGQLFGTRYLSEQMRSLEKLAQTPTARLERLLAEHLDCCTYRLDAWMSGLVNFQLASMRFARRTGNETEGTGHRKGIYLGAYGWLENVRPANRRLTPIRLGGELDEIFNQQQPAGPLAPILRDDQNEGYIHAPSVNHAVTAAVLRNGYIANATPEQPDLLKVNLSSERVRRALELIEGIRNGQSLGALLGYQFERGLHDRYGFAECDQFIYPLRQIFPLVSAQDLPDGVSIQSIEARNVINGLKLIRHIRAAVVADKRYPFGFPVERLPVATAAQASAIDAEIDRLLDMHDALADLAVAEGVHQVVMGNYDRAAATMDAYGQATFPPIPDVVQTPRSGIALTHRVGLQFAADVAILASDGPRVKAEPAVDRWVSGLLPDPARVGASVKYLDAATAVERVVVVTQADLGLQALDMLYTLAPDNLQPRSELDDRIRDFVLANPALGVRPDLLREVSYSNGNAGDFSFIEVAPLVRSMRAVLLKSRPLRSTDVALPTEAKAAAASSTVLDRSRVDFLPAALTNEKNTRLVALLTQLDAVFTAAGGPDVAVIVANIDSYLDDVIEACSSLARYGLAQTSFGIFNEMRAGVFTMVLAKAAAIAERWQRIADQYDALSLTLPSLVDERERIALLSSAERLVSTLATDAAGKTSAQLQIIVDAKHALFQARHAAFSDFGRATETTIDGLLVRFEALLPIVDFDLSPVDTADEEKRIVTIASDIRTRVRQLSDDLDKRIAGIENKLSAHDNSTLPEQRLQFLTDAGRLVFGEDFVLVPSFMLPQEQGSEWANAYDHRESLLDYQKAVVKNEFPVDDWLYGLARVREKFHHVENLTFIAEALGTTAPQLQPMQLPFDASAPWMAMEYPPAAKDHLARELLLYTAHYSEPFDRTRPQCGLLIDEWTEVIPADTETTGLTFHFNKPSAEPPQAILLATPPQFTGAWAWDDLVSTLHETLDMARLRAVEPQQLDATALSVFVPATILATTWQPVTIAADLSVVNDYVSRMP